MKKTLAIVLVLVMVLCMIPAVAAETTVDQIVENQPYGIRVYSIDKNGDYEKIGDTGSDGTVKANKVTAEYVWENLEKTTTGKWTDDAVIGIVNLKGFTSQVPAAATKFTVDSITIDGKDLTKGDLYTAYQAHLGWDAANKTLRFPVELTKAGYADTYVVVMKATYENAGYKVNYTETAKVSVTYKNTAEYKDVKTAVITDVESSNEKTLDAYIVGKKLYLDFGAENILDVTTKLADEYLTFTFADENKKPFTAITWAYDVKANVMGVKDGLKNFTTGYIGWVGNATKLKNSAASYLFVPGTLNGQKITFKLETAASLYETVEYQVVVRGGIAKADPKGIYFADPTATIKVGEVYTPVVMGVATKGAVKYDSLTIDPYSKNILDYADANNKTIIGVREGVAYITASYTYYTTASNPVPYNASSMKIIVTEGESIPPAVPTTTTYVVSCRNLNVRIGAGTSYKKAGMIHRGDAVEVVEIAGGWAKLANGNYVCAKYIYKK